MKQQTFAPEETQRRSLLGKERGQTQTNMSSRNNSIFHDPRAFIQPEVFEFKYEPKIEGEKKERKNEFSFQNLYETPEQYIEALSQRIPLNNLYEVKDCFCENAANEYCAVTVEVKDPIILKILSINKDDRILKVFNKQGNLVYQRVVQPIKTDQLRQSKHPKYYTNKNFQKSQFFQDEEKSKYPYIAMFQNILIFDPREQVPTGNENETEQSILNIVKLDHKKGTKIIKLRFQNLPLERSLDVFANVAYLDRHLLFLEDHLDEFENRKQTLKLLKLDFNFFFPECDEENDLQDEQMKNCVTSHEVKRTDLIEGPELLDGHLYLRFQDIGFSRNIVNKVQGTVTSSIHESIALIDEFRGKISFVELQIKVVQKKKEAKQSSKNGKLATPKKKQQIENDFNITYEGSDFEPKVLFCSLSPFQSKDEDSSSDQKVKNSVVKVVSRMHLNREEEEHKGRQLYHTALVLMRNGEVYFYNEFSLVHKFEGVFGDIFASFELLYLVEPWNLGVGKMKPISGDPKKTKKPHIWQIPTVMRSKAADTVKPVSIDALIVKLKTQNIDPDYPELLVSTIESKRCLFSHTLQQQMRSWVKLFQDFCQIQEFFVVAHDRFVSVYSNQEWLFHEQFPDQVFFITPVGQLDVSKFSELLKKKKEEEDLLNSFENNTPDQTKGEMSKLKGSESEEEDSAIEKDTESADQSSYFEFSEYKDGENLFQIRVLYGLGKCSDLIFPRSMNDSNYRADRVYQQQRQLHIMNNKKMPFRVFQPVSHPAIEGMIFFLTDQHPFSKYDLNELIYEENKYGKDEENEGGGGANDDKKTKMTYVNTIMKQVKEKERIIKETFKNVRTRSEVFFKFTGYSYKVASGWELTLSASKPLLPFRNRYECIVFPKEPIQQANRPFQLWMINKSGGYRRIKLNSDIVLDVNTTQICLQYNAMDQKSTVSIMTKRTFTNLEVSQPCKNERCRKTDITDITFWLNSETDDDNYLRPIDFHKMIWVYKFQLQDIEYEEDKFQWKQCQHQQSSWFIEKDTDESQISCYPCSESDSERSSNHEYRLNLDFDDQSEFQEYHQSPKIEIVISEDGEQQIQNQNQPQSLFQKLEAQKEPQSFLPDINQKNKVDFLMPAPKTSKTEAKNFKNQEDQKLKSMQRTFRIMSKSLNTKHEKFKWDEVNKKLQLHFIFILDGRIMLLSLQDKSKKKDLSVAYENEKRSYSYLSVLRKIPNMNIVSAIDSNDEQDFIYCISDGFFERKQDDLDDNIQAQNQLDAPDEESGAFIPPGLLTIDIRHFTNKKELDYQVIKPAIVGVNSKILLDGKDQNTLIIENYETLGRQPTAHSNKIIFFSFPQLNKAEGYEMLIYRQSQELYEIATNKNEVYQWEVITGRLLSCTKDQNLRLKGLKTTKNSTQHFKTFSLSVLVRDTDTEVLQYDDKGFASIQNDTEKATFMVTIDPADADNSYQKKLTQTEKSLMRVAKLVKLPQKRVYALKFLDARVSQDQQYKRIDRNSNPNYTRLSLQFWFDYSILDDTVLVQGLNNCSGSLNEEQLKQQKYERPIPSIWFTENLNKMLCISNSGSVFIFKKKALKQADEKDDENVPEIEWSVLSVINDIHISILERSKEMFLFDPDFRYYFNFQYNMSCFVVYKVLDLAIFKRASEIHKKIDVKFFSIEHQKQKNMQNIQRLVSRMKLLDDQRIRIVSNEGLDTVYNYMNDHIESFYPIEDFEIQFGSFQDPNLFVERIQIKKNATTKRLIESNSNYRHHVNYMAELDHETFAKIFELQCPSLLTKKPKNRMEYEKLERNLKIFEICHWYNEKTESYEPFVQQTFTVIDWIAMNEIVNQTVSNDHELMSELSIIRLVFNILPTNTNFLEMLITGANQDKIQLLKHFFMICNEKDFKELLDGLQPQLPMIRNLEGKTALDYALQMKPVDHVASRDQVNCFDPLLAEEILKGFAQYQIFSLKEVATAIPRAVEFGIPFLPNFMDLRMKKYNLFETKAWGKNYFKKDKSSLLFNQKNDEGGQTDSTYVTSNCFAAWPNRRKVAERLFLQNNDVSTYSEIDFRVFDIPDLHNTESNISADFFAQLRNVNNSHLFGAYSVSSVIQQRFKRSQSCFFNFVVWPYSVYLIIFTFWLHIIFMVDQQNFITDFVDPYNQNQFKFQFQQLPNPNQVLDGNDTSKLLRRLQSESSEQASTNQSQVINVGASTTASANNNKSEQNSDLKKDDKNTTSVQDNLNSTVQTSNNTISTLKSENSTEEGTTFNKPFIQNSSTNQNNFAVLELNQKDSPPGCKWRRDKQMDYALNYFIQNCGPATQALYVFEYIMILLALYFVIIGLVILLAPLFKGYATFGKTLAKPPLYFDLLPNFIVIVVLVFHKLEYYNQESQNKNIQRVIDLESNKRYQLGKRQALGVTSFILWLKMLFNMKTTKLFGPNLMLIMEVLGGILYFFLVFFIMVYVISEFVWIGSNKRDSLWTNPNNNVIPYSSPIQAFRFVLGLSFYGDTDWLFIQYNTGSQIAVTTDYYYLIVWSLVAIVNNVVMYNLLVAVLEWTYKAFVEREEATLKYTQTETIQDMIYIEKFVSKITSCCKKHSGFYLRKQYLMAALYSPSYIIEERLPFEKSEETDGTNEKSEKSKEKHENSHE